MSHLNCGCTRREMVRSLVCGSLLLPGIIQQLLADEARAANGGIVYDRTDEYGAKVVETEVHVHDFHATILHLLGFDHEKLTFRHAERDFRLTDVAGNVVKAILA